MNGYNVLELSSSCETILLPHAPYSHIKYMRLCFFALCPIQITLLSSASGKVEGQLHVDKFKIMGISTLATSVHNPGNIQGALEGLGQFIG